MIRSVSNFPRWTLVLLLVLAALAVLASVGAAATGGLPVPGVLSVASLGFMGGLAAAELQGRDRSR
jgi:H+/Cl- antiporter ClcA